MSLLESYFGFEPNKYLGTETFESVRCVMDTYHFMVAFMPHSSHEWTPNNCGLRSIVNSERIKVGPVFGWNLIGSNESRKSDVIERHGPRLNGCLYGPGWSSPIYGGRIIRNERYTCGNESGLKGKGHNQPVHFTPPCWRYLDNGCGGIRVKVSRTFDRRLPPHSKVSCQGSIFNPNLSDPGIPLLRYAA